MYRDLPDAILLCGGKGTRLRPAITDRQKCVAEVGGRPFLHYLLAQVLASGCKRAILCVGHRAESVEKAIWGMDFGLEILFSREDKPLGTGGAIRQALVLADSDPMLVMNGDSFCAVRLREVVEFHQRTKSDLTIVIVKADDRDDVGKVEINAENAIVSFGEEKRRAARYMNTGIYCLNRALAESLPSGKTSLEKDIIPKLIKSPRFRITGYETDQPVIDIGTPERYALAKLMLPENFTPTTN